MALNSSTIILACINGLLLLGSIAGILLLIFHMAGIGRQSCPICRKRIPAGSNICPYCGQQL